MSFEVFSRLINKESNKGIDQIINYMNTNPLYANKQRIDRSSPKPETSIRSYYKIDTLTNSVDPSAFAEAVRDRYYDKNAHFKQYNRKTLLDDLQNGNNNYSNDYVHFERAYLKNKGVPTSGAGWLNAS